VTEGTNLASDKPVTSEAELENEFIELFERTRGRVFVSWSGQNIDRTVTVYRAAKRTGRTLAIDLYTADVLHRIAAGTSLPRAGFPNLAMVVTSGLARNYRKQGRADFIEKMVPHGISARKLKGGRHVVMLRRALIQDYALCRCRSERGRCLQLLNVEGIPVGRLPFGATGVVSRRRGGSRPYPHQRPCVRCRSPGLRTVRPTQSRRPGAWGELGRRGPRLRRNTPSCGRRGDGDRLNLITAPAAPTPLAPSVGIFWKVGGVLVIDYSTLDEAEAYGDCLTHAAGHYERWEEWQGLGVNRLRSLGYPDGIITSEYDDWPRGRIVYEVPANRFVLYADRRLQKQDIIAALTEAFRLDAQTVVIRSDAHYR
jgi:hypothetical protein